MITPSWRTADGKWIPLSQMETRHIHNAMGVIRRGRDSMGRVLIRTGCDGFSNAEWLLLFAAELKKRSRHGVS